MATPKNAGNKTATPDMDADTEIQSGNRSSISGDLDETDESVDLSDDDELEDDELEDDELESDEEYDDEEAGETLTTTTGKTEDPDAELIEDDVEGESAPVPDDQDLEENDLDEDDAEDVEWEEESEDDTEDGK